MASAGLGDGRVIRVGGRQSGYRSRAALAQESRALVTNETSSCPGEPVLDPFAGSGSTGVAAAKMGRPCLLIEQSDCPMHDFPSTNPRSPEEVDPFT